MNSLPKLNRITFLIIFCCNITNAQQKRILGYGKAGYTGIVKPHIANALSTQGVQGSCGDKNISCGGPSFNNLSVFYSAYTYGGTLEIDFSIPAFLSYDRIYINKESGYSDYVSTNGLGSVDERSEIIAEFEVRCGGKVLREAKLTIIEHEGEKCFSMISGNDVLKKKVATVQELMSSMSTSERERILKGTEQSIVVNIKKAYVYRWEGDNKFDICSKIACRGASGKDKDEDNSGSNNSNNNSSKGSSGSSTTNSSDYGTSKDELNWNRWRLTYPNNPDEDELTTNMNTAKEMLVGEWNRLPSISELNTIWCSSVKYKPGCAEFNTSGKCSVSYVFEDYSELDCELRYKHKSQPYITKYTYEFDIRDIEKIGYVIQDHPRPDNNASKLFGLVLVSNGNRIKETTGSYLGSQRLSGPEVKMVAKTDHMFLTECMYDDCGGLNNELYKQLNHFRLKCRNREKEMNEDPHFWDNERKEDGSETLNKSSSDFWEKGKQKDTISTNPAPAQGQKDDFWK